MLISPTIFRPAYTKAEAADLVGVPENTLRNWANGYSYPGSRKADHPDRAVAAPLITSAHGALRSITFAGVAEAYVLVSLKKVGLSTVKIRRAVEALKDALGVEHPLLTSKLKTDGAELLYEISGEDLVIIRNGQKVFRTVVEDYLQSIEYAGDTVESFYPKKYPDRLVVVDSRLNSGRPCFANTGVGVEYVLRRVRGGEPLNEVAEDYDLSPRSVERVLAVA